ncbi:MAG: RNA-binding cell elongation regulator Jag/EloR [Bacillota bacterium]|nr:RNA-binding cell elongation regulator Jag/EloR [Bacillota bacterium]
MDEITISGRTVEEAIEAGLDALGAERAEVEVEVIDEGVKGIFGLLGTRLARVRVRRKRAVGVLEPRRARRGEAGPARRAEPPRPETARIEPGRVEPASVEPVKGEQAQAQPAAGRTAVAYRPATPEQVERARTFLENVCRLMGVEGEIAVRELDGAVRLSIEGDQMGLLIGRRGQTLDALQYLTGLVANRDAKIPSRFVVDVEGYRDRRETALRRLAEQTANRVKARGHRAVLEPMSPQERRVIHLALAADPEVFTYSEGEEPYRRVIIALRGETGGGDER